MDIADTRNGDRRLSRLIASWAFVQQGAAGDLRYGGIRYGSRLGGPDPECWAIFGGTHVDSDEGLVLELTNPDLRAVAEDFELRLF